MALVNEKEEEEDAEKALKGEFIEEEPAGLVSGVKIKHLSKVSSSNFEPKTISGSTKLTIQLLLFVTGVHVGQQNAEGCQRFDSEHVRGADYSAVGTQRCWEDHNAVHAYRLAVSTGNKHRASGSALTRLATCFRSFPAVQWQGLHQRLRHLSRHGSDPTQSGPLSTARRFI